MSTILVVDDRPSNRRFLLSLLGFTQHRLLEAEDGARALQLVRAERPDLIITDILMPTMDGYEFVQRLRADPALAATPVIFYSATFAVSETMAMARSCGVQTVLSKPADAQQIFDAINIELGLSETPMLAPPLAPDGAPVPQFLVPEAPGSAEQDIVATLARHGHAAPALARELTLLFHTRGDSLQKMATQLAGLEELCLRVGAERNVEAMIALFAQGARAILDAGCVALCLLDSTEREVRHLCADGMAARLLAGQELNRRHLPGALLDARQPLRLHGAEPRLANLPDGHPPATSLLGLAITAQGQLYGWLYATRDAAAPPFSADDERIATTLAARLALAYENLTLYDLVQRHAAQLQLEATARRQTDAALSASRHQLEFFNNHDPLTLLPNRARLSQRLHQQLDAARQDGRQLALLLFDIDRLQRVNDSLGHASGDYVLQEVARRAALLKHPSDTLAHLGSDEFVLVLTQFQDPDELLVAARRLTDAIAQPVQVGGHDLTITSSVGISIYPRDAHTPGELLKAADVALAHCKESGRNSVRFFKGEMNVHALRWMDIETQLRRAIERGELSLHYQPQVSLTTGQISSMEALLRWNNAELGPVAPGDFIHVAEDTGLILPIGNWVIDQACRQNQAWQDAGLPQLRVAVNVSAHQFGAGNVPAVVRAALEASGLKARYLELELTESVMMGDSEATRAQLAELASMGVSISLDDFGTGYCSLGYLSRFMLDKLKIDQSFVRDITTEPRSAAIAQATVALAHGLSLTVTAEGVETAGQLQFLASIGCDQVQGYLFSRPLPHDEMALLLRKGCVLPASKE